MTSSSRSVKRSWKKGRTEGESLKTYVRNNLKINGFSTWARNKKLKAA